MAKSMSLADLINKQRESQSSAAVAEIKKSPAAKSQVLNNEPGTGSQSVGVMTQSTDSQPSKTPFKIGGLSSPSTKAETPPANSVEPPTSDEPSGESKPVNGKINLGLKIGGAPTGTAKAKTPEPAEATKTAEDNEQVQESKLSTKPFGLEAISDFNMDDVGEDSPEGSGFDDEIPTMDIEIPEPPQRENRPDEDTPEGQFVAQLDALYETFGDSELVAQVVKQIMQELAQHPEYAQQIADADVHTMIRAMRNSMGMARIKKAEQKAKKGSGGRKTKLDIGGLDAILGGLD